MFSDEEPIEDTGFNINSEFAKKYEHNAKRKEIERLESKYGKQKLNAKEPSEPSESSESEDSDAYLNTEKAETKFIDLIQRIKKNDKTLLKMEGDFFKDEDFEPEKKEKKHKKTTLKDAIREDALRRIKGDQSAGSSDDEAMFTKARKGETKAEEEARLKAEFKK